MSNVIGPTDAQRQAAVGERVRRLRTSRGVSQEELARRAGQASGAISMLENGRVPLGIGLVASIAKALLCSPDYLINVAEEPFATRPWLRAYADASKKTVDRTIADSTTAVDLIERARIELLPDTLPRFEGDLNDDDQIEQFALDVRSATGLGSRDVVGNVIRSAERLGCVVLPLDDELGRHLGLSLRVNGTPVMRVSRTSHDPQRAVPGDRQRFTVAHELGHLTLHHATPPPDTPEQATRVERQAHRFAGAYLAPADALLEQLDEGGGRVTLRSLADLKGTWGLSIKALVTRFHQLGVIGDDQSRSLYKQISARKWNKVEPVPVGNESAVWLTRAIERQRHGTADAAAAVARDVGLDISYVLHWLDWAPTSDTSASAKIMNFAPRRARSLADS